MTKRQKLELVALIILSVIIIIFMIAYPVVVMNYVQSDYVKAEVVSSDNSSCLPVEFNNQDYNKIDISTQFYNDSPAKAIFSKNIDDTIFSSYALTWSGTSFVSAITNLSDYKDSYDAGTGYVIPKEYLSAVRNNLLFTVSILDIDKIVLKQNYPGNIVYTYDNVSYYILFVINVQGHSFVITYNQEINRFLTFLCFTDNLTEYFSQSNTTDNYIHNIPTGSNTAVFSFGVGSLTLDWDSLENINVYVPLDNQDNYKINIAVQNNYQDISKIRAYNQAFWGDYYFEYINNRYYLNSDSDVLFNDVYEMGYKQAIIDRGNIDNSTWLAGIFNCFSSFYSIRLFGNVTVGLLLFLPLILSVLLFIFKLARG